MRKWIIILLLLISRAYAQYPNPLPSSGSLSIYEIAEWMRDAGEITQGQFVSNKSLQFLKTNSHLPVKTAPYSISDWYGYSLSTPTAFIRANDEAGMIYFDARLTASPGSPLYYVNQDILIFYEWTSNNGYNGYGDITIYQGYHSAITGYLIAPGDYFRNITITFLSPSSDGIKSLVSIHYEYP